MTQLPGPGQLRVALLTREYPPEVYGGAGVHVTYLARELAPLVDLTVHCQGADRPDAVAHRPWELLADANRTKDELGEEESAFRRFATAVTKYWVCKRGPAHAAEALAAPLTVLAAVIGNSGGFQGPKP